MLLQHRFVVVDQTVSVDPTLVLAVQSLACSRALWVVCFLRLRRDTRGSLATVFMVAYILSADDVFCFGIPDQDHQG